MDPDHPSSYLLGILCDGVNYRNTKTARDREIVQNNVLQGLGWTVCRVWTLDWFENREAVMERLIQVIDKTKAAKKQKKESIHAIVPAGPLFNPQEAEVAEEIEPGTIQQGMRIYTIARLNIPKTFTKDFFALINRDLIVRHIRQVIETEAPISRSLLYKRLMQAWGVSRQT